MWDVLNVVAGRISRIIQAALAIATVGALQPRSMLI